MAFLHGMSIVTVTHDTKSISFFSTMNGESAFVHMFDAAHDDFMTQSLQFNRRKKKTQKKCQPTDLFNHLASLGPSFYANDTSSYSVKDIIRRVNSLFKSIYFHINNGLLEFLF